MPLLCSLFDLLKIQLINLMGGFPCMFFVAFSLFPLIFFSLYLIFISLINMCFSVFLLGFILCGLSALSGLG